MMKSPYGQNFPRGYHTTRKTKVATNNGTGFTMKHHGSVFFGDDVTETFYTNTKKDLIAKMEAVAPGITKNMVKI